MSCSYLLCSFNKAGTLVSERYLNVIACFCWVRVMQRLCSHSSCSCGNARLDAVVNKETGTCVDMDGDETDPISSECFPATEGERKNDLVWCFPCRHVYFREGIEMWLKGRRTCPECRSHVTGVVPYGMSEVEYDAGRLTREAEREAGREAKRARRGKRWGERRSERPRRGKRRGERRSGAGRGGAG